MVLLLPRPLKGESKDEPEVSVGWLLLAVVESARTGSDGSDVRGSARSRVREVDERAAIVQRRCAQRCGWAIGGGGGGMGGRKLAVA